MVGWFRGFMDVSTTCLLAALLAAPNLLAEVASSASLPSNRPSQPAAIAFDLSGNAVSGRLLQMDLSVGMRLDAAGKPVVLPASQLIWIGFAPQPRGDARIEQWFSDPPSPSRRKPEPAVPIRVTLRDGQVLDAKLRDPAGPDTLSLDHRWLGLLDLPLAQIQEMRLQSAFADKPPPEPAPVTVATPFDLLWLSNGDRVEGILRSLGRDQADVELASGQPAQMPTASVQVVRLAAVPAPATAPASQPAASARLCLRSGERILASKTAWDQARAAVKIEFRGQEVTVPAEELAGIEPVTAKWIWLSDLQPAGYEHQPRLAPSLSWQRDATVRGDPIYCNGQPVLRGLGVPSGSTLRYDLGGGCTKLIVWPILDDSAGPNVSCNARILIDGQPAWQGTVKATAAPQAVTVSLAGWKELMLQVEPAASDVLTRFVWAWPVLMR